MMRLHTLISLVFITICISYYIFLAKVAMQSHTITIDVENENVYFKVILD